MDCFRIWFIDRYGDYRCIDCREEKLEMFINFLELQDIDILSVDHIDILKEGVIYEVL